MQNKKIIDWDPRPEDDRQETTVNEVNKFISDLQVNAKLV